MQPVLKLVSACKGISAGFVTAIIIKRRVMKLPRFMKDVHVIATAACESTWPANQRHP